MGLNEVVILQKAFELNRVSKIKQLIVFHILS